MDQGTVVTDVRTVRIGGTHHLIEKYEFGQTVTVCGKSGPFETGPRPDGPVTWCGVCALFAIDSLAAPRIEEEGT